MLVFMVISFLWVATFITEKTAYITMASAASFYFTSTRQQEGSASVSTAFNLAYTKHLGSIAFGSGIHTVVHILAEMAEQAARRGSQ